MEDERGNSFHCKSPSRNDTSAKLIHDLCQFSTHPWTVKKKKNHPNVFFTRAWWSYSLSHTTLLYQPFFIEHYRGLHGCARVSIAEKLEGLWVSLNFALYLNERILLQAEITRYFLKNNCCISPFSLFSTDMNVLFQPQ